jgi:hypothetical protein
LGISAAAGEGGWRVVSFPFFPLLFFLGEDGGGEIIANYLDYLFDRKRGGDAFVINFWQRWSSYITEGEEGDSIPLIYFRVRFTLISITDFVLYTRGGITSPLQNQ